MHEELLETPHERGRGLAVERVLYKHIEADEVAETERFKMKLQA